MAGASAAKSPPIHDLFVYITIFFLRRMFFLNLLTDAQHLAIRLRDDIRTLFQLRTDLCGFLGIQLFLYLSW